MERGLFVCASCGAPQPGRFCERCGEKRITTHDYSIVHFGENLLETLTHFDFRSIRALKILALRPGELTRAYIDGRRRSLVGPIQLFVILNIIFAFLGANTFRTPLNVQQQSWLLGLKQQMVQEAKARHDLGEQEFAREFDRTAGVQAKTWIFAMIPAYALILAVLYGFRRYLFEHLVFATHFIAFVLLWILVAGFTLGVGFRLAGVRLTSQGFDNLVSLVILGGMVAHLFLALRRAYGDRWFAAAARALVMAVAFLPVLKAYRLLLFFVTLKTMH